MSQIFIFDTETTGLPEWNKPSGDVSQPHIVELAGLLVDENTREVVKTMSLIVKPDGWVIPQVVIDIHGITNDHAEEVGISEKDALEQFLKMWSGHRRIAHGTTSDNRIIRIAAKRYRQDAVEPWKAGAYHCTGQMAKKAMGIKGRRIPKLSEAYAHFFGKEPETSHRAMADARSCMAIYFAIKDGGAS